eukprot:5467556-Pyramimonas_sp.AAC.1
MQYLIAVELPDCHTTASPIFRPPTAIASAVIGGPHTAGEQKMSKAFGLAGATPAPRLGLSAPPPRCERQVLDFGDMLES